MADRTVFLIAHNIRSLYNVGSFFRIADALGIEKLYLTGYTGTPNNPRLAKTALGAERTTKWQYCRRLRPLLKKLRTQGVRIVALENRIPGTVPLSKFQPHFPLAILVGEEVKGIKKDFLGLCDKIVEIPMQGQKESLNVSVAAGIAAYHIAYYGN